MKELVGIVKDIDKLGRITVPKDFRDLYGIEKDVEIIPTEEGILIRNPLYKLVKRCEKEKVRPVIIITEGEIKKSTNRKKRGALN